MHFYLQSPSCTYTFIAEDIAFLDRFSFTGFFLLLTGFGCLFVCICVRVCARMCVIFTFCEPTLQHRCLLVLFSNFFFTVSLTPAISNSLLTSICLPSLCFLNLCVSVFCHFFSLFCKLTLQSLTICFCDHVYMFPWLVRLCFWCCAIHALAFAYVCACVYMWVCGFTLTCAWGPLYIMTEQQAPAVHICLSSSLWSTYPMPPSTYEARLAACVCCTCACRFVCVLKAAALTETHRAIRALHPVQLKSMICLLSWLSFTSCCLHNQIQCASWSPRYSENAFMWDLAALNVCLLWKIVFFMINWGSISWKWITFLMLL